MGACGGEYRPRRPEATALHQAVREGFPAVLEEASSHGGLPRWLVAEVHRYLRCGVLRHGFVHVQCTSCKESLLVAFSCKGRGLCPSCGARRMEETAASCDAVLPEVAYRQWTLSLPWALRWPVVKAPQLLKQVERRLVRAVWRGQRQSARQLGHTGPAFGGAVAFRQYFGSALQLTPHLHVLVPEGLWDAKGGEAGFVPLPPPTDEDVEAILRRVLLQLGKDFEGLQLGFGQDALEGLRWDAVQQRLALGPPGEPRPRGRRVAVLEGFSLHAGTAVHAHDRAGLLRLCRYGSRGPLAQERLSRTEDGRYAYRSKKGPVLVWTAAQLVKRLLALVPPRGKHLTSFHGVFAPNAKLRPCVIRKAPRRTEEPAPKRAPVKDGGPKRPRLDWATLQKRTFVNDVWACPCGGMRRVRALVSNPRTAEQMLRSMGRLQPAPRDPSATPG